MSNADTGNAGEAGRWLPLIYRGDGAWIGVMPGGQVGVGVEGEGRATLQDSGYVPLWPFMERGLSDFLGELYRVWGQLEGRGFAHPGAVVELTVSSAWRRDACTGCGSRPHGSWRWLSARYSVSRGRAEGWRWGLSGAAAGRGRWWVSQGWVVSGLLREAAVTGRLRL